MKDVTVTDNLSATGKVPREHGTLGTMQRQLPCILICIFLVVFTVNLHVLRLEGRKKYKQYKFYRAE